MTNALNYQPRNQFDRDADHLKVLSICWIVAAILALLAGFLPLIYSIVGMFLLSASHRLAAMPAPMPATATFAPATAPAGPTGAATVPEFEVETAPAPGGPVIIAGPVPMPPPRSSIEPVAWMFIIFGSAGALFFWTASVLGFIAAASLPKRRRLWLCYVAAGLACAQIPFGTTLGVFTFIVLTRPSVRQSFA